MKITYSYNELIKEYNYDTNKIVDYTYDNSGNIVEVTTTDINNNIVLETNNYNYTNSNWEDQLTKYNNEDITCSVTIDVTPFIYKKSNKSYKILIENKNLYERTYCL